MATGVASFSSSYSYSYSYSYSISKRIRITSGSGVLPLRFNLFSSYSYSSLLFSSYSFQSSYSYSSLLLSSSSSVLTTRRPIIVIMSMTNTNQNNNTPIHNNIVHTTTTTTILGANAEEEEQKKRRRRVVLLLDVMDTVVRDPFYHDIPSFFGMSLKELIDCKHPTAWIDFETGLIDEMELARIFFKDGRPFDLEGLKSCMKRGFSYLQGMEELLHVLKRNNYEMHALTNYPIWYEMIEDKLKLSKYLSWSFCSCSIGKRKPDPELYAEVVRRLEIGPENCIFIDDRMRNVEAAIAAGMVGLQFKDAKTLQKDLSLLGIQTEYQDYNVES